MLVLHLILAAFLGCVSSQYTVEGVMTTVNSNTIPTYFADVIDHATHARVIGAYKLFVAVGKDNSGGTLKVFDETASLKLSRSISSSVNKNVESVVLKDSYKIYTVQGGKLASHTILNNLGAFSFVDEEGRSLTVGSGMIL